MQHFIHCCWYSRKSGTAEQNVTSRTLHSPSTEELVFLNVRKAFSVWIISIYMFGHIQPARFVSVALLQQSSR